MQATAPSKQDPTPAMVAAARNIPGTTYTVWCKTPAMLADNPDHATTPTMLETTPTMQGTTQRRKPYHTRLGILSVLGQKESVAEAESYRIRDSSLNMRCIIIAQVGANRLQGRAQKQPVLNVPERNGFVRSDPSNSCHATTNYPYHARQPQI